jgi:Ribbon-helix-helix protein, copG family
MRTTLSLDDDVAALLQKIQKKRDATLKEIVNEALRQGLERMSEPPVLQTQFRTRPADLGKCYFPNLDNTWEVLAEAEGESYK